VRPHERWVWTELIGFDREQPDRGVAEYLEAAGFVPAGICLLLTCPSFVLAHQDQPEEVELPPDFCARNAHDRNPLQRRQAWTNWDLKALIRALHDHGIQVYLTVFTWSGRFREAWLNDHPEAGLVVRDAGWAAAVNVLARLADGSYVEDLWAERLTAVLEDYGFDGWHEADGFGPLGGPIYRLCVSDDTVAQFLELRGVRLPPHVAGSCGHDLEKLERRAAWLWRHAREEWIAFYAERWGRFWHKTVAALHARGKRAVVNSAWGREPFESLYRYGVDYRRIAQSGVDGIIVETVAAGLCMDPRPSAGHPNRHHDFLAMLMLLKASVPGTRLIFLHNVHDTVEEWDAVRHRPAVLEREIEALSNVVCTRSDGGLAPCADGFLVCLGDGLRAEAWTWLRERWALAFSDAPRRTLGATLIWSNAAMDAQLEEFVAQRPWTVHRLLFHLLYYGAPVHAVANVRDLAAVQGAILVLNPHLLPAAELEAVLAYRDGPAVLIDPGCCRVMGEPAAIEEASAPLPGDPLTIEEPDGFWDHLEFRPLSEEFLRACVETITRVSGAPRVTEQGESVCLMATETSSGALRLALKNKTPFYARPTVELPGPATAVEVLTPFPSVIETPTPTSLTVCVPPEGVTVVAARPEDQP